MFAERGAGALLCAAAALAVARLVRLADGVSWVVRAAARCPLLRPFVVVYAFVASVVPTWQLPPELTV
jgi:hypothetical protein